MIGQPRHPALYQINTRVWLHELSEKLGRPATLADFPDSELAKIENWGFNWLWLMGVWHTGEAGRHVSRSNEDWRPGYAETLGTDWGTEDVCGSPFAISSYTVHSDFGGDGALARLRKRLQHYGLRLLLDFVPNHTALDHPWVDKNPEFYIHGSESDLKRESHNYCRPRPALVLAHGRDLYLPGWPDTLQLNYWHPGLRKAMMGELSRIARMCDGLRCDMAMLILPDIIRRIWGSSSGLAGLAPVDSPFWVEAIQRVREKREDFLFLAEVYWNREWDLQMEGFDYTSDKNLYDRLRALDAGAVRGHLGASSEFQRKSVRFLENHDEDRAAKAFSHRAIHEAAAVVTYLVPGMHHFHEGQLEGRRRKVSVHVARRLAETPDPVLQHFYDRLLECMRRPEVRDGDWELLNCLPSSEGNPSFGGFIAFTWSLRDGRRLLVAVNYAPNKGQCHVPLRFAAKGSTYFLIDLLSCRHYERNGAELFSPGLYLDMEPWDFYVFELVKEG